MTRPVKPPVVVLLDVDGVVNRVGDLLLDPEGFDDFKKVKCAGFTISYSDQMVKRLAALEAEIVWLSTWEADDHCNKFICPLFGWKPLPVIVRAGHDLRASWWKSSAAEEFVKAEGRPFVWLDDDLHDAERMGEVDWLRGEDLPPKLLIAPDYRRALLPRHLDQIETFIAEQRGSDG